MPARLANRPFLVFDFRAFWRSTLSTRMPMAMGWSSECPKVKN